MNTAQYPVMSMLKEAAAKVDEYGDTRKERVKAKERAVQTNADNSTNKLWAGDPITDAMIQASQRPAIRGKALGSIIGNLTGSLAGWEGGKKVFNHPLASTLAIPAGGIAGYFLGGSIGRSVGENIGAHRGYKQYLESQGITAKPRRLFSRQDYQLTPEARERYLTPYKED